MGSPKFLLRKNFFYAENVRRHLKTGGSGMKENYSSRWSSFKCRRCGQCCENLGLPWPAGRLEEMAKFLNMDPDDLIRRYYGEIVEKDGKKFVEKYQENRRTPCPFLQSNKNCAIYLVRPNPCRAYPLDTDFGRCGIDCPAAHDLFESK